MTHHHPYLARILIAQRHKDLRKDRRHNPRAATHRPTRNPKREFADFLHIVN